MTAIILMQFLILLVLGVLFYFSYKKKSENLLSSIQVILTGVFFLWVLFDTLFLGYIEFNNSPSSLMCQMRCSFSIIGALMVYYFCEFFPGNTQSLWTRYRILFISLVSFFLIPFIFTDHYLSDRVYDGALVRAHKGDVYWMIQGWILFLFITSIGISAKKLFSSGIKKIKYGTGLIFLFGILALPLTVIMNEYLKSMGFLGLLVLGPEIFILLFALLVYGLRNNALPDPLLFISEFFIQGILIISGTILVIAVFQITGIIPSTESLYNALFLKTLLIVSFSFFAGLLPGSYLLKELRKYSRGGNMDAREFLNFVQNYSVYTQKNFENTIGKILEWFVGNYSSQKALIYFRDNLNSAHIYRFENGLVKDNLAEKHFEMNDLFRCIKLFRKKSEVIDLHAAVGKKNFPGRKNSKLLLDKFTGIFDSILNRDYSLLLPLKSNGSLIGFLLLGSKKYSVPYFREEIADMKTRISLAALSLKYLLMMEESRLTEERAEKDAEFATELAVSRDSKSLHFTDRKIVFESSVMQALLEKTKEAAGNQRPVLISGETGTGKELIARALHEFSDRNNAPFVAVNCGAVPSTMIEDELFGHEKGAFTDAFREREGRIEEAKNGTLFLDEIGEMTLDTQVKLLRVIQEMKYSPVGGKEKECRCRFVFATNKNLEKLVKENKFRDDLYYRINVFELFTPPLRERKEDLLPLISYFTEKFSKELGKPLCSPDGRVLGILTKYNWPGNIRELENVLFRTIAHSKKSILSATDLPPGIIRKIKSMEDKIDSSSYKIDEFFNGKLEDVSRQLILDALIRAKGNKSKAARLLGISRGKLRHQLDVLEI